VARRAVEEFAGLGGRDLLLTGGEPFLTPELPEIVTGATRFMPVTILTNAMVFSRGSRRRMLEGLDRDRVTMQVSLDSGTPALHDRHRGAGAFDRAGPVSRCCASSASTSASPPPSIPPTPARRRACTRDWTPTASRPPTGSSGRWRAPASPTTAWS